MSHTTLLYSKNKHLTMLLILSYAWTLCLLRHQYNHTRDFTKEWRQASDDPLRYHGMTYLVTRFGQLCFIYIIMRTLKQQTRGDAKDMKPTRGNQSLCRTSLYISIIIPIHKSVWSFNAHYWLGTNNMIIESDSQTMMDEWKSLFTSIFQF